MVQATLFPYGLLDLHISKTKPATPLARGWQALPTIYLKTFQLSQVSLALFRGARSKGRGARDLLRIQTLSTLLGM